MKAIEVETIEVWAIEMWEIEGKKYIEKSSYSVRDECDEIKKENKNDAWKYFV